MARARLRLHDGDHADLRRRLDRRRPLPPPAAGARRRQGRLVADRARLLPLRRPTSSPTCSTSSSTGSWSASRCCSGRSPAASATRPPPPEGARRGSAPPSSARCAPSPRRWRRACGPLPPAAGPEPAPGGVDPVAHLEPLLATLPRRTVLGLKLGLRVFEWLPFPWRFSRASLAARQDFLARDRGLEPRRPSAT